MAQPTLKLIFDLNGGQKFLIDAQFTSPDPEVTSDELRMKTPRGSRFRGLCILMLLAKYRGDKFKNDENQIPFKDKFDRKSWLTTLGDNFQGLQEDFFEDYFGGIRFLSAKRSGKHMSGEKAGELASAYYHLNALPLKNLTFFTASRSDPEISEEEIKGKELVGFAKLLEKYEVDLKHWNSIVSDIAKETVKRRTFPPSGKTLNIQIQNPFASGSVRFFTDWREAERSLREYVSENDEPFDWYFIGSIPLWIKNWNHIIPHAVARHGANVKIALHSIKAIKRSTSLQAQLFMYGADKREKDRDSLEVMYERIERLKSEIVEWKNFADETRDRSKKSELGTLELFESIINHPFQAVLAVPRPRKPGKLLIAPPGSFCAVGMTTFYRTAKPSDCCLHFSGTTPLLDIYFKTITEFFETGRKTDKYLCPVELAPKMNAK